MKINKKMKEYNATINIIAEIYYLAIVDGKKGAWKWNQLALFTKQGEFIRGVRPIRGEFFHWSLLPLKIIRNLNSFKSYHKWDLKIPYAVCVVDENLKIIESSREVYDENPPIKVMKLAVKIDKRDGKIFVKSPYSPNFPVPARRIGGRWLSSEKAWVFDVRDEADVRDLCLEIYGEFGDENCAKVDLLLRAKEAWKSNNSNLFFAGRQIAKSEGKNCEPRLGPGVIVKEGNFYSAGSHRNYYVVLEGGSVVELRDVPLLAAETAIMQCPSEIEVEIIGKSNNACLLKKEREKLVDRLEEIDRVLSEKEGIPDSLKDDTEN